MAHIRSWFPNKIRHPCRHCKSGSLPIQFYTSVELVKEPCCSCTSDTQLGEKLSCSYRSPYVAIFVDICESALSTFLSCICVLPAGQLRVEESQTSVGKWRQARLPSLPATAAHERSSCESCIYKEPMQYIGLHCTSLAIYKKHEPCIFWDRNSVLFIRKPSRQQLVTSKPMTRCPPPNLQEK